MKRLRFRECKTTKIRSPEFSPSLLPEGYKKYFDVVFDEDGDLALSVGSYVGLLPCESDFVIQLDSKVPISDLSYLLLRSREIARWVENPSEDLVPYEIAKDDLTSFFEALVSAFLVQVDKIKRLGFVRREVQRPIISSELKGKIDFGALGNKYSRATSLLIPQAVREYELSNTENRVLAECLRFLYQTDLMTVDKRAILTRLEYFSFLRGRRADSDDLLAAGRILAEQDLPQSRSYYLPALDLALLILRGTGITLGSDEDLTFKPIMINTSDVFERYVRSISQDFLKDTPISVLKGKEFARWFYDSGVDRLELEPDVVFVRGGDSLALLDVKYKTAPTASDHYQMSAYMEAYGLTSGAFVTARGVDDPPSVAPKESKRQGRTVYELSFDLQKIRESEKRLNEFVRKTLLGGV